MAESPPHKFGQIIGNILEDIMRPVLESFCKERGLYLDVKGERLGVRAGKKVCWTDKYGNTHDLDFVIEKGGSKETKGRPVAFIEAAWRRYTKHSRNKAQEIQGAVLPIAEEYCWDKPFLGAVLAGEFTGASLSQLKSVGFHVLYFPYESILSAFSSVGIDARFDDKTSDGLFTDCIAQIESLKEDQKSILKNHLITHEEDLFNQFLAELGRVLDRAIEQLFIIPLYGSEHPFYSITEAIQFLHSFDMIENKGEFRKFEIIAKYTNGDAINASFVNKGEAERFLKYLGQ